MNAELHQIASAKGKLELVKETVYFLKHPLESVILHEEWEQVMSIILNWDRRAGRLLLDAYRPHLDPIGNGPPGGSLKKP